VVRVLVINIEGPRFTTVGARAGFLKTPSVHPAGNEYSALFRANEDEGLR